jgi:hypothetical protein
MISIKEIAEFQAQQYDMITTEANKIHPKLLRRISFDELFSDDFKAQEYEDQYNKNIKPLISYYETELDTMINSHLYDILEGWIIIHPDKHFGFEFDTGKPVSVVPSDILDALNGDILINVELEDYYSVVREMKEEYTLKPFWQYSYVLYGNGQRPLLCTYSTSEAYIKYNRLLYKNVYSTYEQIANIATDISSLPFKMNYPPMDNNLKSAFVNSDLTKMLKHHKVLNAFFEKFGKDAGIGDYSSYEDENGKIKFTRIQY